MSINQACKNMSQIGSYPMVSVIVACRNEEGFIKKCLDSILAQDYPRDKYEILVVDGMSNDGTRRILNEYADRHANLKVIDNPARITPKAFNLGIQNSRGEIISLASAHSTFSKNYISRCVEYLNKTGADSVGGPMRAVGNDYKSRAIAYAYNSPFGLGGGKAHNHELEGEVEGVYPGCWPRRVFERVGLFDERLIRNQDIEFEARLRKSGGRIFMTPAIKTEYYCRPDLKGLWIQNFRNGLWNVRTSRISPGTLRLRHFVPLFFVLALLMGWMVMPLWLAMIGSYLLLSFFFSLGVAMRYGLRHLPIMPMIFLTLHLSYGLGTLAGILSIMKWKV
jgi:succinoglycan biosynthesis protein ExoA